MRSPSRLALFLVLLLMPSASRILRAQAQQVSSLLGTKTIYSQRLPILGAPSIHGLPDPAGYEPHTLWLLSRHGSRWPTADRMRQINSLEPLFQDAANKDQYAWMRDWRSPVGHLMFASGELHAKGEEELWSLARRLRRRFPGIAHAPYVPKRFPIVSTQVARAAASASAFATGFFPSVRSSELTTNASKRRRLKGVLQSSRTGRQAEAEQQQVERRPQAVAITMMPKLQDPLLRFFDQCPRYAQREADLKEWLGAWTADGYATLAPALSLRLNVSNLLGPCDVEALWTLCQFEAGIQGVADRACSLFTLDEFKYLEWLSDVGLLEAQAWGSTLNYHIAAPLLHDMRDTLQEAAASSPGAVRPHARLLFAHCETLVPLATLLGLFQPELPPTPPSAQVLQTAVPARTAQGLLAAADALEDVGLHEHIVAADQHTHSAQQGKAGQQTRGSAGSQQGGASDDATSTTGSSTTTSTTGSSSNQVHRVHGMKEGVTVCSHGLEPHHRNPPDGWYPMTPFNESRTFRGGRVSPFGANMAVVLYMPQRHTQGRPLVRLLYNEQVIPVPGCSSDPGPSGLKDDQGQPLDCDLEQFLQVLKAKTDKAQTLDKLCAAEQ